MKHDAPCSIIEGIQSSLNRKDHAGLAISLVKLETAFREPAFGLCQKGIFLMPKKDMVKHITDARSQSSEAMKILVNEQFDNYETSSNYKERRQILEDIIRLLQTVPKDDSETALTILLAKAYLFRGLLFRPRGFTTPARKIEAIKKARVLAEKVLAKVPENTDALKIWAYAALELESIPEERFQIPADRLQTTADHIVKQGVSGISDMKVLIRCAELTLEPSYIQPVMAETRNWNRQFDLLIFKAKSGLLENRIKDVQNNIRKAITAAPETISDPFWDELALFLKQLKSKENSYGDIWKPMAIDAHRKCMKNEISVGSNIFLMKHWARQKSIYNLAFLAENSEEQKMFIADSLKARPMMRYQTLHEMRQEFPGFDRILEQENEARDGRYLKQGIEHPAESEKESPRPPILHDQLPKPWVAVHFYLDEDETNGHALIYDSNTTSWKHKEFDYSSLYHKAVEWQEIYNSSHRKDAMDAMVQLCRQIGVSFPFLFDANVIPEAAPVLWIPHGFLHQVPLHAAIHDQQIFFHTHSSRYLPAWHLLNQRRVSKGKGKYIIFHVPEDQFSCYSELDDIEWTNMDENDNLPEGNRELMNACLTLNPDTLMVLCHGERDVLNPFKSKLKLKDGFNISDILKSDANIEGTRIFLAACESDMAPPVPQLVDEHLSLSTAFLSKGAKEIIAGLWEIDKELMDECYADIINEDDVAEALRNWQINEMQARSNKEFNELFYNVAPFRIIGMNIDSQKSAEV